MTPLKPGREMDAKVAACLGIEGDPPAFSTDANLAMSIRIVDKSSRRGSAHIKVETTDFSEGFSANIWVVDDLEDYDGEGDTPAAAICEAVLEWAASPRRGMFAT